MHLWLKITVYLISGKKKKIKLNLCLQSGDHGLPKKTPLKLLLIDDMFQKSATGNHILVFAHV